MQQTLYPNYEVILVDNASTDGTVEAVRTRLNDFPIKILQTPKNLYFAGGNNFGVRKANGTYIVFLNNDTIVTQYWLTELVRCMESDPRIGACQSKLLTYEDRTRIDSTGDFVSLMGSSIMRGRLEVDTGQYDNSTDIFSARGASMMVRKSVVEKVGCFDEDYLATYEDVDLCWRIRLAGFRVRFVPKSIIYHKGRVSMKRNLRMEGFLASRNLELTLIKNFDTSNLLKFLPIFLMTRAAGFLFLSLARRGSRKTWLFHLLELVNAQFWILTSLRETWIKRLYIRKYIRKASDDSLMPYFRAYGLSLSYSLNWASSVEQ